MYIGIVRQSAASIVPVGSWQYNTEDLFIYCLMIYLST